MTGKDSSGQSGGFRFGRIGGDVNQKAGGDIVSGKKITHYHQLPTGQQNQAQSDLESLRDQFKSLADAVAADRATSAQLRTEIATRLAELDEIKGVLTSKSATTAQAEKPDINGYLTKAGETLEKIGTITTATTSVAATIGSIANQTLPYLASLRGLLGL